MLTVKQLENHPKASFWESDSLADHVGLIQRQWARSVADPRLEQLVQRVLHGPYSSDHVQAYGKALRLPSTMPVRDDKSCVLVRLWNFAVLNVQYVPDPEEADLFMTAEYILQGGEGDCDDFTILLGAMLKLAGFRKLYARVITLDAVQWAHVYLLVGLDGRYVPLDPTVQGAIPGWEFGRSRGYQDFELS